jgi:hypothetical protein
LLHNNGLSERVKQVDVIQDNFLLILSALTLGIEKQVVKVVGLHFGVVLKLHFSESISHFVLALNLRG